MKNEKTIKTHKPIVCTGIVRIPSRKALTHIKQLLGA